MSAKETYSKNCYRCDQPVEMTGEQFLGGTRHLDFSNDWTVCPDCKHNLAVEAHYAAPAGSGIPRGIKEVK